MSEVLEEKQAPGPFAPLDPQAIIVRLATRDSVFLPAGAVLPLPEWLLPSSQDKEEATRRNREPGLSVWDDRRTTVPQARTIAEMPLADGFSAAISACAATASKLGVVLDFVSDPIFEKRHLKGWDGHSLVEGLSRPKNEPRQKYLDLRVALVEHFSILVE